MFDQNIFKIVCRYKIEDGNLYLHKGCLDLYNIYHVWCRFLCTLSMDFYIIEITYIYYSTSSFKFWCYAIEEFIKHLKQKTLSFKFWRSKERIRF